MILKKLNEHIDITLEASKGIFYNIHELVKDLSNYSTDWKWLDEYTNIDLDYYLGHSGDKYLAPLYQNLLYRNKNESDLAKILLTRFSDNWIRRFKTLLMEYNPINNYDMEEREDVNSKITVSSSQNGDYSGFNVPSDASNPYSPVNQNKTESTSSGDAKDNVRNLRRSGNIGVITSAELVSGELKLRVYDFIESVMKDIDSISLLMVY